MPPALTHSIKADSESSSDAVVNSWNSLQNWGALGDYFGGVINPIIAYFGIILVAYGLYQTKQEIEKAKDSFNSNLDLINTQNFDNRFFQMLELLAKKQQALVLNEIKQVINEHWLNQNLRGEEQVSYLRNLNIEKVKKKLQQLEVNLSDSNRIRSELRSEEIDHEVLTIYRENSNYEPELIQDEVDKLHSEQQKLIDDWSHHKKQRALVTIELQALEKERSTSGTQTFLKELKDQQNDKYYDYKKPLNSYFRVLEMLLIQINKEFKKTKDQRLYIDMLHAQMSTSEASVVKFHVKFVTSATMEDIDLKRSDLGEPFNEMCLILNKHQIDKIW